MNSLTTREELTEASSETQDARYDTASVGGLELDCDTITDVAINEKTFGIRTADTDGRRSSANLLINKMYAWRGYTGTHRLDDDPNRITLSASDHGEVVGTVTLGIDSPVGLLADEVFKDEIDRFRERGAKVCEITKLAFDPKVRSKAALASLFHVMFIYGRRLHKCTDVFIEVNPRHAGFYKRMLGFHEIGGVRMCPRVNAPAVLLHVELDYMRQQIALHGGRAAASNDKSLYPYFLACGAEASLDRALRARARRHH